MRPNDAEDPEDGTRTHETRIRLADEADAAGVRAIYAPVVEETVVSFEGDPPSEAEMADRIADTLPEHPWLVCEVEGRDHENEVESEIAGYAYASPHRGRTAYRWSVDVSVYVAEEHRRRGIGRGLYESLLALLDRQGFRNAYAGIALPNEASVALHESFGFEPVGVYESVGYKRGEWHDVGWWQLRLRDRGDNFDDFHSPNDRDSSDGPDDSDGPNDRDSPNGSDGRDSRDGSDGHDSPEEPRSVTDLNEDDRREALEIGVAAVRS